MSVAKLAAANGGTGAMKAGCALALLLFARVAIAQNEAPVQTASALPTVEMPAVPPKISYAGGQLRINASGSTLGEVLAQVAVLTGVNIDIPAGANSERMPVVELGPGPARQVLASLLSDTNFDYLIQASDGDPGKIQNVLVMPREKKGSGAEVAARAFRGPNVAAAAPPEAPAADGPVPPSDANSSNPAPAAMQADQSALPAPPNQSGQFPLLQPDPTNPAKPGALTPPAALSPDSINQQLQQMYQQRVQMTQQDHFTGTQSLPAIRGAQ